MNIESALTLAIETAKESNMKRYRLGAILYDKNKCVTASNYLLGVKVPNRSTPWSMHAEEFAIIKGSRSNIDFKNSTLIVVRINKNNKICMAKPCPHCTKLIIKFKIPKIYYSTTSNGDE